MKAKNFEVISKSGSVMIQAMDIDGALKAYRLHALDENVLCIRESISLTPAINEQPDVSEEEIKICILEVVEQWDSLVEWNTRKPPVHCILPEHYHGVARDSAKAIIQSIQPAVSDDHNYLQSPGFEHLSNGVQESGTSTDHTILVVSDQPDVSEDLLIELEVAFLEGAYEPSERGAGFTSTNEARQTAKEILNTWLQSIQPAKGEDYIRDAIGIVVDQTRFHDVRSDHILKQKEQLTDELVKVFQSIQPLKVAKVDECPICGSDDLFSFQQTHYKCRECDYKFTN